MNKSNTKIKKTRGPKSGLSYPYYNLEDSVEVANVVHNLGGGSCNSDQLASFLNYSSVKGGAFISRVSSAKQFGLITSTQGHVSVTELARNIFSPVMEDDEKKAKVDAFLNIELFKAVFERFKGRKLPPPAGLKNLFANDLNIVKDRVAPAQRVLMQSARYAGFFETNGDETRLIEPVTSSSYIELKDSKLGNANKEAKQGPIDMIRASSDRGEAPTGIHSAIIGLLRELPAPGPWEKNHKERFMLAFKSNIDFIYPDRKEEEQ